MAISFKYKKKTRVVRWLEGEAVLTMTLKNYTTIMKNKPTRAAYNYYITKPTPRNYLFGSIESIFWVSLLEEHFSDRAFSGTRDGNYSSHTFYVMHSLKIVVDNLKVRFSWRIFNMCRKWFNRNRLNTHSILCFFLPFIEDDSSAKSCDFKTQVPFERSKFKYDLGEKSYGAAYYVKFIARSESTLYKIIIRYLIVGCLWSSFEVIIAVARSWRSSEMQPSIFKHN